MSYCWFGVPVVTEIIPKLNDHVFNASENVLVGVYELVVVVGVEYEIS